jgi:hypothetical protein
MKTLKLILKRRRARGERRSYSGANDLRLKTLKGAVTPWEHDPGSATSVDTPNISFRPSKRKTPS